MNESYMVGYEMRKMELETVEFKSTGRKTVVWETAEKGWVEGLRDIMK